MTPTQLMISQLSTKIRLHPNNHRRLETHLKSTQKTLKQSILYTEHIIMNTNGFMRYQLFLIRSLKPSTPTVRTVLKLKINPTNQTYRCLITSLNNKFSHIMMRCTTSSAETYAPISRNNITRYSLREAPVHKTFCFGGSS